MSNSANANRSREFLPKRRSNRPVTIGHRLEYAIVVALFGLFGLLGIDRASAFGGASAKFFGRILGRVSQRAVNNLRMVYPDWDDKKIQETVDEVWENLGRTAAEYAHLKALTTTGGDPRIEVVGAKEITPLLIERGCAIFITGHFANWEVAGITATQLGLPFGFIYRASNNPLVDELIIKKRAAVMTTRQIPKGWDGARGFIDLLKDRHSIAILMDQKLTTGGIPVPFMGHTAMTSPAAARLALRFNLPLVQISTERLHGAYFKVVVHDPIPFEPSGNLGADIEKLTIKINEALEKDVRARPGQWLWLHRRWPKINSS